MTTSSAPLEAPTGYSPEEAALLMRLRVFVNMRWLAIAGVLVAALVASLAFHIGFPVVAVYSVCGSMVLYNFLFVFQARAVSKEKPGRVVSRAIAYSDAQIVFDLIALVVLLHFTGGIENPFIFYFVFHAILASVSLSRRATFSVATMALVLVLLLVGLEYAGWLRHYNLQGFVDPTLYKNTRYVLAVLVTLTTMMYGATYMTAAISSELRKRQQQVVELGNQLLEKKTEEVAREKEMQEKLSAAYRELSVSHEQLKQSQEQLIQAEKLTSLGQLAASIAHEINNPLAGVLVYTQLIAKKLKGDGIPKEQALEYLSKMEFELIRSSRMVRNLLDFARQSPPTFRPVNLIDVINRALELVGHSAELQHVQIVKEMDASLPPVLADFDQLNQVFTNMILNAMQAMPDGGKLVLRNSATDGDLRIDFIDTGRGISPENMRKLFTPFFTTKPEVKGVGLGLAISYGIIQRHRGRIEVQSQEGKGTTFSIFIPRNAAPVNGS